MRKYIWLVCVFIFPCIPSHGQFQDMFWIGGTGNWDDPTNWDTGVIPTINNIPRIQNATDTVFIPPGFLAQARRLEIDSGATLIVVNESATLQIVGNELANKGNIINHGKIECINTSFASDAVENFKGYVENFGSILVQNSGGNGVQNYWKSTFINHAGALITIDTSDREGVLNNGTFVNHGSIETFYSNDFGSITNGSYYDIIEDTFYIASFINTGEIKILGAAGSFSYGLKNTGIFDNLGGLISIDSAEWGGIHNQKANLEYENEFNNSGTILIKSGVATESFKEGITNLFEGQFINEESGIIRIDSLSFPGTNPEKYGIRNYPNCSFINRGSIDLTYIKYGISNSGIFINDNHINTTNMAWGHITNTGSDAELINNGNIITRASFAFGGRIGNVNGAKWVNNGLLYARDRVGSGGIFNTENSLFINTDSINCSLGIVNHGTFTNDNGKIALDSAGITNEGENAYFTNDGFIDFRLFAATLRNSDKAFVENNGTLNFNDVSGFAAIWCQDDGTQMTNNGEIFIENVPGGFGGVWSSDSVIFENNGFLSLKSINSNGISLTDGTFYNSGIINMSDSIARNGFSGMKKFINLSGGVINLQGIKQAGIAFGNEFINEEGGVINILSSGPYEFPSSLGAGILVGSEFTNGGELNIGKEIQGAGIKFRFGQGEFTNLASGNININQAEEEGINLERGAFENFGRLVFRENISKEALIGPDTLTNHPEGKVEGIGIIDGSAFVNNGLISPGFSPGIFNITDFNDHSNAILNIEIAGTDGPGLASGHDQIISDSIILLGGILNVDLIDDYTPTTGDSFTIITCDEACQNTFDSISLNLDTAIWDIEYTSNAVILNFINAPPTITSTPIETATEDQLYQYEITAIDPNNGDDLSYTIDVLPTWLDLTDHEDGTATLSGTPTNDDVGSYNIEIKVEDNLLASDIQSFTIEVINVNDTPQFTSTPIESVNEDELYSYDITAFDEDDGDVLTITATVLPSWLSLVDNGDGTALLSGTPTNDDIGLYDIELVAEDNASATDTQNFNIEVININDPPQFTSTPIEEAIEDELYEYFIEASDIDIDESLAITGSGFPDWLTLTDNGNGTAILSGTPLNEDVGIVDINLTVTDSENASDEQSFQIKVVNTNDPPEFISEPVLNVNEGELYTYNIETSDPDLGDILTITVPTPPDWLELIDNGDGTATLSGEAPSDSEGQYEIELTVSDADNATDQQAFVLEVGDINQQPFFTSTPIETATEDELYVYEITTGDPDDDELTITVSGLPEWLNFNDNGDGTAVLEGTPSNENVGGVAIQLTVSDNNGGEAEQSFLINVLNANDPPEFISSPILTTTPNIFYNYEIEAIDPDTEDLLTITAAQLPNWLTLEMSDNGKATLKGITPDEPGSQYQISLRVEDLSGAFDLQDFTITISGFDVPIFQTALTPNGDGLNDTWKIDDLEGCSDCKIEVFNRWGNKVFSSIGYENEWDGTNGSTELPTGTYYYIIDFANGEQPKSGTVSILR